MAYVTLEMRGGATETVRINPVVGMDYQFAANNVDIVAANIHGNVTCVPPFAFCGCTSLARVHIPRTVKHICVSAFMGCTHVAVDLRWIMSVGPRAFKGCLNIVKPPSAVYVHPSAF